MAMERNKRILTASLCVLLAVLMLFPTIGSPVKGSSLQGQDANQLDIQATGDSGQVKVAFADITEKIESNEHILGTIGNKSFSFILKEGDMGLNGVTCIGVDGKIDEKATQDVRHIRVFVGTDLKGAERSTAVMTDDWISIYVDIDGITYCVDGQLLDSDMVSYHLTNSLMHDIDRFYGDDAVELRDLNQNVSSSEELPNGHAVGEESCETNQTSEGTGEPSCFDYSQSISTSNEDSSLQLIDTDNNTQTQASAVQSTATSILTTYTAKIIMACDLEYRNTYPNWASQLVVPLWNINVEYTNQVSIDFLPTLFIAVPSGYCTSTNVNTLLTQFSSYMNANWPVTSYLRDLAHLSSGKWLDSGALGLSNEPGVNASRWAGGPSMDYGVSYECSIASYQNTQVLGHEIGHNFNGDHSYAKDYLHTGWGEDSWMWPTYGILPSMTFTTENAQRIRSWVQQAIDTFKTINIGPSSVSSQNLQASNMCIIADPIYRVGYKMTVSFLLKNTGSTTITLNYVFIGARDANNNNRDFGYVNNVVITPGSTFSYSSSYTPQYSGTWTFWPAYNYGGSWGPYQWITVSPTFYFQLGSGWSGHDVQLSYGNMALFYRFNLYSLTNVPAVGSTIWVRFTIYDFVFGTSSDHLNNVFVACRLGSTNKNFGYSGGVDLTQRGINGGLPGTGYLEWASRTLDAQGTWQFWPSYQRSNGLNGPDYWHTLSITI